MPYPDHRGGLEVALGLLPPHALLSGLWGRGGLPGLLGGPRLEHLGVVVEDEVIGTQVIRVVLSLGHVVVGMAYPSSNVGPGWRLHCGSVILEILVLV